MRKWLESLVDQYLPAVEHLTQSDRATALEWAAWMKGKWAEHGMSSLPQQKNLMTEVRGVIKQRLGERHVALETLNFSEDEWTQLNHAIAARAAQQNESQVVLSPEVVNAIVTRATTLLSSREWADIAAGLAVVTGRRSSEVMKTAQFELASDYSVWFVGALKRRGEETVLRFEIPTLCQAQYVVAALAKLRSIKPTDKMSIAEVNQYAGAVAGACDQHFADIVPAIEGRDNLYTHLFRKIYATIATYFYCPPTVDEAEFRAEIQGHFAGHEGASLAAHRTIASDRHYRSYIIQDGDRNMRKGVRLDWRGVAPITAFQRGIRLAIDPVVEVETVEITPIAVIQQPHALEESAAMPEKMKTKRPELSADDLARMQSLMAHKGVTGTYGEVFTAMVELLGSQQAEVKQEVESIRWFQGEIDNLRSRVAQLERERNALKSAQVDAGAIAAVRAENQQLKSQLHQTQAKLEGIQQFLGNGKTASDSPVDPAPNHPTRTRAAIDEAVAQPSPTRALPSHAQLADGEVALDPDALRALQAIMDYNDEAVSHNDRWTISIPVMKDLLRQVGKATQTKINAVLKAKAEEIEQHHRQHGLGERHNRVHKGRSVSEVVRL